MDTQIQIVAAWLGTGSINIFGRPFSGKDTQGEILAQLFGGALIGGGDILRSHHEPKKVEEIMASGGIIPLEFYERLVLPYLTRGEFAGKPLILSAVGRSHGEETVTMRAAKEAGHPFKAVVYLEISEDEVWERFEAAQDSHDRGARADDNREVLKTRLQKFRERTLPAIEFYREKGLLIEVTGTHPEEQVTHIILNHLARFAAKG
jgi:adenylate kinase